MSNPKKQVKRVKAWAVRVSNRQTDTGGQFLPFGNGKQFQYPIFPTRQEALSWWNEDRNTRGLVFPCTITYSLPLPTKNKKR